ncbi:YkvI family membrane protein [Desulfofundulus thermosubterraneus]|uniref:YkvI family membrane protein n=1 Tax=Desulfofundulus thermosubterraneus TaxID=348840 RepID=UPI0031015CEF
MDLPGSGGFRQWFQVSALYVGTVIGAGFASGQEITQFFIIFGEKGLWGVSLATLLFGVLGFLLMTFTTAVRCSSYVELLPLLMGRKIARLVDWLSLAMLPGGLVVMLAGSGALFNEQFGLPTEAGTMLAALITALVILGGLEGVLLSNMILVPVKVCIIALVCLLAVIHHGGWPEITKAGQPLTGTDRHWLWSSVLYVSYNMVVPLAVLSSLGRNVEQRPGVLGGVTGGIALGSTAVLVTLAGLIYYPQITRYQVPLLCIAGGLGEGWRHGLGVLIWLAIITTAIADAHGFASRLAPGGGIPYRLVGLGTILLSLPLARMDFTLLVQLLYPLFGYAGLVIMAGLLIAPFRLKLYFRDWK